ncbi:hypothetical protein HPB48_016013 [Haemaphysalis longicornis]|uniref:Peptidase S1 domain-containing protein n=1 Tax=Haemaphysalis longicornis TaxID=44386 RepID=A0A9J6G2E3_HAELO|nr:hypothetical protein HPB48_016013 [Haemaphysalis longicornis]
MRADALVVSRSLVRNGEPVFVRVGDHDLGSERAHPGAQTRRVATTYIHHNHNGQSLDNDIALLKLQEPVQLNSRVCPVCLPARGAAATPGNRCTVTGYGYLGEGAYTRRTKWAPSGRLAF